jgi:ATP-dependent Clp protease ATP-binding subunit ClpC
VPPEICPEEAAVPKINVYLPDDLAAAVRSAGFAVSPVCQQALAEAVRKVGAARRAIDGLRRDDFDPTAFPHLTARAEHLMTPRLRQAIERGEEAARTAPIATVHLLLGMLDEGGNLGTRLLETMGVDLAELRATAVHADVDEPSPSPAAEPGGTDTSLWTRLTVPARLTLANTLEVAVELGHNYLGCEHLLVGLAEQADGVAARLLRDIGVEAGTLRRTLPGVLHGPPVRPPDAGVTEALLRRLDAIEARLTEAGL